MFLYLGIKLIKVPLVAPKLLNGHKSKAVQYLVNVYLADQLPYLDYDRDITEYIEVLVVGFLLEVLEVSQCEFTINLEGGEMVVEFGVILLYHAELVDDALVEIADMNLERFVSVQLVMELGVDSLFVLTRIPSL